MLEFLAPPTLDMGNLKDMKIKVGETIKYELPISGEPTPEVTWTVDGKPLKSAGRCKIIVDRNRTILKVITVFIVINPDMHLYEN